MFDTGSSDRYFPAAAFISASAGARRRVAGRSQRARCRFCARITARTNAMRSFWWERPFDVSMTVAQFCKDPDAPDFCPVHFVGEIFAHRTENGMELPSGLLNARTLREIAEAFHRPVLGLARVNPQVGLDHRLDSGAGLLKNPDPGFAAWLTARFAGAALANSTLPPDRRVAKSTDTGFTNRLWASTMCCHQGQCESRSNPARRG